MNRYIKAFFITILILAIFYIIPFIIGLGFGRLAVEEATDHEKRFIADWKKKGYDISFEHIKKAKNKWRDYQGVAVDLDASTKVDIRAIKSHES